MASIVADFVEQLDVGLRGGGGAMVLDLFDAMAKDAGGIFIRVFPTSGSTSFRGLLFANTPKAHVGSVQCCSNKLFAPSLIGLCRAIVSQLALVLCGRVARNRIRGASLLPTDEGWSGRV
jgi:hypothetical protein